MRIKHWSGYGNINVTKKAMYTFPDWDGATVTSLTVFLRGNHEQGLWNDYRSSDPYFIYSYLIKRFDKDREKPKFIKVMEVQHGYCLETGEDTCVVRIAYRD